jgi:pSer/pThr/pTyr-binding forkhead associated (FHA) protein
MISGLIETACAAAWFGTDSRETGHKAGSRFLLSQPVTSAARLPGSDIFLDDVTVSRRHAEFRWENDEFHVDVGSLNSTYVNRDPVDSAVLVNGDEVQIDKFRLTFLTKPKTGFCSLYERLLLTAKPGAARQSGSTTLHEPATHLERQA